MMANSQQINMKGVVDSATKMLADDRTEKSIRFAVLTYLNDLVRHGDIAFGTSEGEWHTDLGYMTKNGENVLEHADRDPMNYSGYLAYLDNGLALDAVARGYVEEALSTYRACCHKAAAILIGAAVERLVLDLRDELVNRLKATGIKPAKDLEAWQVKNVIESLAKKLLPDLAGDAKRSADAELRKLHEEAECRLLPIAAEFRKTRNQAGHPASLSPVDPADVHANLLLFPSTAKMLKRLKEWIMVFYV